MVSWYATGSKCFPSHGLGDLHVQSCRFAGRVVVRYHQPRTHPTTARAVARARWVRSAVMLLASSAGGAAFLRSALQRRAGLIIAVAAPAAATAAAHVLFGAWSQYLLWAFGYIRNPKIKRGTLPSAGLSSATS